MQSLRLIALATSLIGSSAAAAVNDRSCVDLAATVGAGLTYSLSSTQLEALRHYANCSASQTTAGGGLDVAYAGFGLGAKYDESRKASECSLDVNKLEFSNTDLKIAKTVFEQGLATVNLCLEKASRDWAIVARQTSADSVSVTVSNLNTSGGELAGVDIIPEGSLSCPGIPTSFPMRLSSTAYLSMTCYRAVKTQMIDGVEVKSAPDATLNLRLADGPFPISLKGYSVSPLDDIRRELSALQSQIQKKFESLDRTLYESSDAEVGGPGNHCPPGMFVVAVGSVSVSGGRHGFLESVNVACKPIRFDRPTQ